MGTFRLFLAAATLAVAAASVAGGTSTVLIDGSGSAARSPSSPSVSSSGGVVAVVGDYASLGLSGDEASVNLVSSSSEEGPAILTARYAPGHSGKSGAGARGVGAASAAAGAVVVAGETSGDVARGMGDSRAGRALSAVFAAKLALLDGAAGGDDGEEGREKTLLIVAVVPEGDDDVDAEATMAGVKDIFDAEAAAAGSGASLEDLYEVQVKGVTGDEDAEAIMEEATAAAAARTPSSDAPISSTVSDAYAKLAPSAFPSTSSGRQSPAVAAALLACDSASARHRRSVRARLSAWKSRAGRGLIVERFGSEASALLKKSLDAYDRDTAVASGLSPETARYRLEVRDKLRGRAEDTLRELFDLQVGTLRRRTLKQFEAAMVRATRSAERTGVTDAGDERAIARRTALFAFDAAVKDLEVPGLGLTKSKSVRETEAALNDALVAFEDNPAAKAKIASEVKKTAAKERAPTERSVDAKVDLVAMIRPDGYGNLQGFVGYQTPWGSQVTVGVQNDADSPEVIGQFGGVRPPFLRVQPKLKLDVEL